MNSGIADTLARGSTTIQSRRASLLAIVAMALATPAAAPLALEAKNKAAKKASKKVRKAVEKTCQLQVPLCEVSLSAVCQPGPDVQECLDNTSECCELLGDCDAAAAMACIVTNFID